MQFRSLNCLNKCKNNESDDDQYYYPFADGDTSMELCDDENDMFYYCTIELKLKYYQKTAPVIIINSMNSFNQA